MLKNEYSLHVLAAVVVVFFFPGHLPTPLLYNLYNLIRLLEVSKQSKYDIDINKKKNT